MKKYLLLMLIPMLVLFAGCQDKTDKDISGTSSNVAGTNLPSLSKTAVKVVEIIDTEKRDNIPCDQAFEKFYTDEEYEYFFSCIKSEYVVVKYSDGTQKTVKEALEIGDITVADLDEYEIEYTRETKVYSLTAEVKEVSGNHYVVDAAGVLYQFNFDSAKFSVGDTVNVEFKYPVQEIYPCNIVYLMNVSLAE